MPRAEADEFFNICLQAFRAWTIMRGGWCSDAQRKQTGQ
jgi:hypothetical protein